MPPIPFGGMLVMGSDHMNTIAIIGGGASGMAAALAARESLDNRVILLERQNRLGRKLLATGNGRCNLTNRYAGPARYHGADPDFVIPALTRFGPEETLAWFRGLGLVTRTEEPSGRVYPLSDAAASVLDTLRLAAEARGAEIRCGFTAAGVRREKAGFRITSDRGEELSCDRLIIACGGMAGERLGGVKDGYELLRSLGHRRTALYPSLVQIRTENTWTRAMKGVRTQASLTLERNGAVLASSSGEVQFTDYGISGPAVFDLSRYASAAGTGCVLVLRLLPELSEVDIISYIENKTNSFSSYKAENLLSGCLHNSISRVILRRAGIALDAPLWSLDGQAPALLASLICRFELPVTGVNGFQDAQVTAGGMETAAFDPGTMESRLVPGLFACGEVLDIDGDCGGFNLQWAWSSGRTAGLSAART